MERIWAPWRRGYVIGKRRPSGCLFCRARRAPPKKDSLNFVLRRSPAAFLILNRYPYTNGHLMVVPNRHVSSLEQLKDRERLDLLRLLDQALALLRQALHPHGFNIGINLGRIGGAGIPGHAHLHVVPRWAGDTNFMPVLTGSKVISDSLEATYRQLRQVLRSQG